MPYPLFVQKKYAQKLLRIVFWSYMSYFGQNPFSYAHDIFDFLRFSDKRTEIDIWAICLFSGKIIFFTHVTFFGEGKEKRIFGHIFDFTQKITPDLVTNFLRQETNFRCPALDFFYQRLTPPRRPDVWAQF